MSSEHDHQSMRSVLATLLCLAGLLVAAGGAAGSPTRSGHATDLASTIKHRFVAKHYGIYAPPVGASYGAVVPNQAFYVTVDFATQHAFNFYVFIYSSRAKATAAYNYDSNRIAKVGSGAARVAVNGRVEFLGITAPLNTSGGPPPTLPPNRFSATIRLAEGR
jgi:hypothetical protein